MPSPSRLVREDEVVVIKKRISRSLSYLTGQANTQNVAVSYLTG
jgi:hypothetical protein